MLSAAHCAADVQALIPFSLKAQEQGPFSLKCFVKVFLLLFFYYCDFTKGGGTGERVPTRDRPPGGFISPCLCKVPMKGNRQEFSVCFSFCSLSSLYKKCEDTKRVI